jgi:hypothetical protein
VRGSRTLLKGHLRESVILALCNIACLRTHFFKILDLSFGISTAQISLDASYEFLGPLIDVFLVFFCMHEQS